MTITWGQFHLRYLSHQSLKLSRKLLIEISFRSPRDQWVKWSLCAYFMREDFHNWTCPRSKDNECPWHVWKWSEKNCKYESTNRAIVWFCCLPPTQMTTMPWSLSGCEIKNVLENYFSNSLTLCDAHMHQWTGSALLQKKACPLLCTKSLHEPMLSYYC